MKIWIDLANSPQVLFFRPLIHELERCRHTVVITTRRYAQTVQLADLFKLQHTVIGQHGGRSLAGLIKQNYLRAFMLANWARRQRFDLAASHNSYSQVAAAWLLGLPAVTLMDYEHQPLNHLCFRLARRVIVPEVFPPALLKKYGAKGKAVTYPGLKEEVYLADFRPLQDYRSKENLPCDVPLVVIRPPATWTAYHRFENDLFDQLLQELCSQNNRYLLFLPRIPEQRASVAGLEGIHVAEKVYDGPNLLYHADLVISGGGTMNREAAVLGTPTCTVFKGELGAVDRYLIDQGRMTQLKTTDDIYKVMVSSQPAKQPARIENSLVSYLIDQILTAGN